MSLTPFITQDSAPIDLQEAVVSLAQLDALLYTKIPDPLRLPLIDLLRQVNSYYSNKIEGNLTLPADVLRAHKMATDVSASKDILEIKRHIDAQQRLSDDPIDQVDICTKGSISRMHREFYTGTPEKYLDLKCYNGEVIRLVPGEFRGRDVIVGNHLAPSVQQMQLHMNWFERAYRLDWIKGAVSPILAAAGSHHHLMWIHPFLDGNGRTGRLFTDQYLRAAGLGGYGLWSINRGFCRDVDAYYAALKAADRPRTSDHDGRGLLSGSGLMTFTRYFIDTALDQVQYFTSILEPQGLLKRIHMYFAMRDAEVYISPHGEKLPKLNIKAFDVFKALMYEGGKDRSEIQAIAGLSEYSTKALISQMAKDGLIVAEPRKPLTINLSRHAVHTFFPNLFV